MKTKLLQVAARAEEFKKEVEKIKQVEDWSESFKDEKIAELEETFKKNTNSIFENLNSKLDKESSSIKEKLKEMQSGSYDERQYQYAKAINELNNYNNVNDYLQDKLADEDSEIAKQEARKAALSKAKAKDPANYESIKQVISENMSDDEKELRKNLAKVSLKKQNLKGAKSSFDIDSDNVDMLKTTMSAYGDDSDLDEKAAKRIADTI